MFKKLLIANRGEIACRIIRTCRQAGIATVAVYSEADADALHVQLADERVLLGPAAGGAELSRWSTGSSTPAARPAPRRSIPATASCPSARPSPRRWRRPASSSSARRSAAIEAMGDKIESKRLARQAGVSTVPGTLDAVADPTAALEIAREHRLSGDGQGLGRRRRQGHAHRPRRSASCSTGSSAPRSEARSSFGDDRVFIEKYVVEPRHIEIQVLGDRHGNIVYLGERECSIQRRHQKVIEEAPSPFLDERDAPRDGRAGRGPGRRGRLPLGRHGRVHRRPRPQLLLPRDEHAAAGRAPGDRAGHRPRSGRADDPGRRRRASCRCARPT